MGETEERPITKNLEDLVSLSESQVRCVWSIREKMGSLSTYGKEEKEEKMPNTIVSLLNKLNNNLNTVSIALESIDKKCRIKG